MNLKVLDSDVIVRYIGGIAIILCGMDWKDGQYRTP